MRNLRTLAVLFATTLIALAAPLTAFSETLYVRASSLNVRSGPGTEFDSVGRLSRGQNVEAGESRDGWTRVTGTSAGSGWVYSNFLGASRPQASATRRPRASRGGDTGGSYRAPYTGSCDCPYHTDRAGRRCGARSAYSRPGGRSPRCY